MARAMLMTGTTEALRACKTAASLHGLTRFRLGARQHVI